MTESKNKIDSYPNESELSEREKLILRMIIHLYILKAAPIGSRTLSKHIQEEIKLSPATIRNVMADLEELDYINHPHTSAGRMPTDKGYRFYVDTLKKYETLTQKELIALESSLKEADSEYALKNASKILGMLSSYLGVVSIPNIIDLKVIKIELIPLTSNRVLVVIALDSNIVRTVALEAEFDIEPFEAKDIVAYINEKVSGKTLKFIRDNFKEMISETNIGDAPLVRLFVDSVDTIFSGEAAEQKIHVEGAKNLLAHPEFGDLDRAKGVIELLENEDIIIHLLDKYEKSDSGIQVLIGKEIQEDLFEDYALIVSKYNLQSAKGSIGLIGPKRMQYSKMISLVKRAADILTK